MYFELRRYTTAMSAAAEFQRAFQSELLPILEDHGFDLVGAWTVEIGDGGSADLLWLLRWRDLAHRQASLEAARLDPRNDAFRDAHLSLLQSTWSQLLKPTSFSPLA